MIKQTKEPSKPPYIQGVPVSAYSLICKSDLCSSFRGELSWHLEGSLNGAVKNTASSFSMKLEVIFQSLIRHEGAQGSPLGLPWAYYCPKRHWTFNYDFMEKLEIRNSWEFFLKCRAPSEPGRDYRWMSMASAVLRGSYGVRKAELPSAPGGMGEEFAWICGFMLTAGGLHL